MANPSLHDVSRLRIQPSIGPNPLLNRVQALKQEYSNRVIALADETLANIASRKPDPTAQIAAEILLRETKLPTSNRVGLLLALHEPLAEMRWVQPDPGEPPEVTLGLFDEKVAEREGQERRRRIGQWSEECYQGDVNEWVERERRAEWDVGVLVRLDSVAGEDTKRRHSRDDVNG